MSEVALEKYLSNKLVDDIDIATNLQPEKVSEILTSKQN